MEKKRVILIWFRNDLRLHDNEVLSEAVQKADLIIPVYCFDSRYYLQNNFNNKNTGVLRAQFIIESVQALKNDLIHKGSDLMTYYGLPEEIIPRLASKYEVDEVYHHREVANLETLISEKVEEALWQSNKINLKHFIGHTMYHKEDLPFPIKDIPDSFSVFRKKVERESSVRQPRPTPEHIFSPNHLEQTSIPSLEDLGFTSKEIEQVSSKELTGGEHKGLELLEELLSPSYKGIHQFTLISPYTAVGALSPVYVYHKLMQTGFELDKKRLEQLTFRLLWRDYFRFMLKKYPNVYFKRSGALKASDKKTSNRTDKSTDAWKTEKIGEEFIDEAMTLLKRTGNLPYKARTILGLYLLQETHIPWLECASFFEEHLIDYTPSTTYGYWAHIAGVGTSNKDNISSSWKELIKKHYPNGLKHLLKQEASL